MVYPASIDESIVPPNLTPGDVAEYLARRKAEVVSQRFPDDVVLAADTVVAHGQTMLGKPTDPADARRMLGLLSGTTHTVITGVAVFHRRRGLRASCPRRLLRPHAPPDRRRDESLRGQPRLEGKAGGYGIQDPDPFVTRTSGCHTNIVGLPITTTATLLRDAGITPLTRPS